MRIKISQSSAESRAFHDLLSTRAWTKPRGIGFHGGFAVSPEGLHHSVVVAGYKASDVEHKLACKPFVLEHIRKNVELDEHIRKCEVLGKLALSSMMKQRVLELNSKQEPQPELGSKELEPQQSLALEPQQLLELGQGSTARVRKQEPELDNTSVRESHKRAPELGSKSELVQHKRVPERKPEPEQGSKSEREHKLKQQLSWHSMEPEPACMSYEQLVEREALREFRSHAFGHSSSARHWFSMVQK